VTAAFIGPGTVFTASQAGSRYGYALLWAVAFSVFSAVVLQEMAARLGIVTGSGLAQAIEESVRKSWLRVVVLGLVLLAILVGNAAYQTGNILGGAAGVSVLLGSRASQEATLSMPNGQVRSVQPAPYLGGVDGGKGPAVAGELTLPVLDETNPVGAPMVIAGVAWLLIVSGKFELLQKVLTLLVVLMSGTFLIAAVLSHPDGSQIVSGLLPSIPPGSGWLIVSLIGTTVVPYNLFLHASAAAHRWPADSVRKTDDKQHAIKISARGTSLSVGIGGLVTASILIASAQAFHTESAPAGLVGVNDLAIQLRPVLGDWAGWLFGFGLLAAGLTSAITAPIAAAYTAAGCLGWPNELSDWRLKAVASIVLFVGVVFAIFWGSSPREAIILAQAANGLLLPLIAIFLLIIMNRAQTMFRFRNTLGQNVLGVIVIGVVTVIAIRQLDGVRKEIRKRYETNTPAQKYMGRQTQAEISPLDA
jgi:Mn2+/Fe2+ NRAMP family transporter